MTFILSRNNEHSQLNIIIPRFWSLFVWYFSPQAFFSHRAQIKLVEMTALTVNLNRHIYSMKWYRDISLENCADFHKTCKLQNLITYGAKSVCSRSEMCRTILCPLQIIWMLSHKAAFINELKHAFHVSSTDFISKIIPWTLWDAARNICWNSANHLNINIKHFFEHIFLRVVLVLISGRG